MNLQPTLTGTLLDLRPLNPDDFEELFAAASDPLIWEQHPEPTRYQREVFEKYFATALACRGALVILDKIGKIIGCTRYYDPQQDMIKVGYTFLTKKHWGGTYNLDLKYLILSHAFQFVDKVLFEIGKNNLRSQRAMEKVGGKIIEHAHIERVAPDHFVFMISKLDFYTNRSKIFVGKFSP